MNSEYVSPTRRPRGDACDYLDPVGLGVTERTEHLYHDLARLVLKVYTHWGNQLKI